YFQGYPPWGMRRSTVEPTSNAHPIPARGGKCFRVHSGQVLPRRGSAASITAAAATGYGALITIDGLAGMSNADVGRYLVISGAATSANNTVATDCAFPTVAVDPKTSTSAKVVGPAGAFAPDANNGAIGWQMYDGVGRTGAVEPTDKWAAATMPGDLVTDN